jgi:hypothetical protein
MAVSGPARGTISALKPSLQILRRFQSSEVQIKRDVVGDLQASADKERKREREELERIPCECGLIACDRFLEILVKLAAATRSSGLTMATTYDCRVGTSI